MPPSEVQARISPLDSMRRAVAERVARSKREIPHFYALQEIDMRVAEELLGELRAAHPEIRLTLTHLLMKAIAVVVAGHPRLNARLVDEGIAEFPTVNLGMVVALEDGMLIPVLKAADQMPLVELACQAVDLAARARARRWRANDLTDRTFTVSNLGALGLDAFAAVISPPDAAILALGSVADRPVVRNGSVAAGRTMTACLSVDHRIADGALAASFMADLRRVLENLDELKRVVLLQLA